MSALIRTAVAPDVDDVLRLWLTSDAEPTHTDNSASVSRLIDFQPGSLIVAADETAIVGSIIAAWDGWRGSIYRLVVSPAHRRSGLATRLVRAAETRLEAVGATRSQAVVVESDGRAMGFWRAAGWEQQSDRVRFVTG